MKNKMLLFMMIFFISFTAILCSQDISENGGVVFFRFIPDPDFKIIMKEKSPYKKRPAIYRIGIQGVKNPVQT